MSSGLRAVMGWMLSVVLGVGVAHGAAGEGPGKAGVSGDQGISDLDLARRLNTAFVQVVETVTPAVVVIRVEPRAREGAGFDHRGLLEFLPEELRKDFEEHMEEGRRNRRRSMPQPSEQGSGVILREDGYVLTNGHVVKDAAAIEVRLQDGRRFPATVRGMDSESDLAVLKIEGTGLPAVRLGDSSRVRVGEFAIAIGAPFELEYSVTVGHISAKGRRVFTDFEMADQDFLQTDASINPGNSGGPLVNIEGEVIGINSLIRGMNTGIGFAVPINLAREVAERLIESGRFTRAWLGIYIRSLKELAGDLPPDLPVSEGVLVMQIQENGPSWNSELKPLDVITGVEGSPVRSDLDLKRQISRRPVGKPVRVEVYRGGSRLELKLTPGELPGDRFTSLLRRGVGDREGEGEGGGGNDSDQGKRDAGDKGRALGLTVRDLEEAEARRLGLEMGEGVIIEAVAEGSPAADRKIEPGEVILRINRKPVRSVNEFDSVTAEAELRRGVSLTLMNEQGRRFVVLKSTEE